MSTRFELYLAYAFGILLPLIETARRRTDFSDIPAYIDDYIAGGMLLFAAWSTKRKKRYGPGLLAGTWGVLCGGAYYSFFGQLKATVPTDISGFSNELVVAVKGGLFLLAMIAFVLSVRSCAAQTGEK